MNRLALAFFAVCLTAFPVNAQTIKIVSSLPRTGSANSQSSSIVNGIQLAIEEIGVTVAGYKIAYHHKESRAASAAF